MANLFQNLLDKVGGAVVNYAEKNYGPIIKDSRKTYKDLLNQLVSDNGVTNMGVVQKLNPTIYNAWNSGKIDSNQAREIIQNGYVQAWKDAKTAEQDAKNSTSNQSILGTSNTNNTNSTGLPDYLVKNVSGYSFNGNKSKLTNEYLGQLWNEINIQHPELSNTDKTSYLESIIAASFPESHMGADYQNTGRNSNIWNIGYNSSKGSNLKYDPVDTAEMAKYAVQQLSDTFGFINNKGPEREMIFNYVNGNKAPHTPENEAKVDFWISAYNTGLNKIGAQQLWNK